ncbi:hypothetical protein M758_4G197900 [Ceratodon purpureus]|nr:hypothetical protein M758_4G197900 [Ceratodon purpureus]
MQIRDQSSENFKPQKNRHTAKKKKMQTKNIQFAPFQRPQIYHVLNTRNNYRIIRSAFQIDISSQNSSSEHAHTKSHHPLPISHSRHSRRLHTKHSFHNMN